MSPRPEAAAVTWLLGPLIAIVILLFVEAEFARWRDQRINERIDRLEKKL